MRIERLERGHRALRRGRRSIANQPYLVTFATYRRVCLFQDTQLAMAVAPSIVDARTWRSSALLAWVLMPDHWHGLIQLGDGEHLSDTLRRLKGNSARVARQAAPTIKQVWARGFHDRALRGDESLQAAARYLGLNPIRAGIVSSPGAYAFWDAGWI